MLPPFKTRMPQIRLDYCVNNKLYNIFVVNDTKELSENSAVVWYTFGARSSRKLGDSTFFRSLFFRGNFVLPDLGDRVTYIKFGWEIGLSFAFPCGSQILRMFGIVDLWYSELTE